ncbi:MAG: competence/damage-inducible protein A [Betaproteobacteria bacterium]|nr:competence/damage-inducible protein A [Betaproteobacteria bacterium]
MKTIAALIIGDEILSGKRQDKHLSKVIEALKARGLSLTQALYLGDEPERIVATLKDSFATDHLVFSFGGIGATPDDYTRQCAAAALGVALAPHPEAVAAMAAKPGFELTPNRLKMAEFPVGSRIIPNPYNQIAAFSCGDHHFLPGFPEMAWPMMEWVLDTHYAHLFHPAPQAEETIVIHEAGESTLIDAMNKVLADFPGVKLSSLPQHLPAGRIIELSIRGDPAQVPGAMAQMQRDVHNLGYSFDVK